MDARNAIELLGRFFLMPAGMSMASLLLLSRWMPERYAAGCGLACAMLVGFLALNDVGEGLEQLLPTSHWHWLAWLPAIALIPFGLVSEDKTGRAKRYSSFVLVSVVASVVLVPDWPPLDDSRMLYRICLCASAACSCMAIDFAVSRAHPAWLLGLIGASLLVMAPLLAFFLSVTYATVMTIAAGSVVGLAVARFRSGDRDAVRPVARATAPIAVLLLFGGCFIGFVDRDPPLYGFLTVGALPVVPMLFAMRPGKPGSVARKFAEVACGVVVFGVAAAVLHFETRTEPLASEPPEAQQSEPASEDDWFQQLDRLDDDTTESKRPRTSSTP